MNGWVVVGVIVLNIWLFGLLILRGIGDCIERLMRIQFLIRSAVYTAAESRTKDES